MSAQAFCNLAENFVAAALKDPQRLALECKNHSTTYGEFLTLFYRMRRGLEAAGFKKGDRIVILLPVSLNLYALLLSTLSMGLVCVSIDATLPKNKVLDAILLADPSAIISIEQVLKHRFLFAFLRPFAAKKILGIKFYSADSSGIGLRPLSVLLAENSASSPLIQFSKNDQALMTYTSGSTGRPKAADRSTGILLSQHEISRDLWPHSDSEIDMPCFPMLALQNLSCGISTVLPDFDMHSLGDFDPALVAAKIRRFQVSRISGPPSFFQKLSDYLIENRIELTSVKSLVTGGATVPTSLASQIVRAFPSAECHLVYGSTEAEPISHIEMRDWIKETNRCEGYLVGKPIEQIEVKIYPPGPVLEIRSDSALFKSANEQGEIILRGPHVVRQYRGDSAANAQTKIPDGGDGIWHRTGDLGFFDEQGRLWLVGRIADQINTNGKTYAPYPLEQKLETVEGIKRAAVLNGTQGVRVYLETALEAIQKDQIAHLVHAYCGAELENIKLLKKIPVDHRHFWKIDRNKLHLL